MDSLCSAIFIENNEKNMYICVFSIQSSLIEHSIFGYLDSIEYAFNYFRWGKHIYGEGEFF